MSDDEYEYGNIRIPRGEFDRHNERRRNYGMTWAEYMNSAAPEPNIDVEDVVEEVADRLVDELGARQVGSQTLDNAVREVVREETRRVVEEVART